MSRVRKLLAAFEAQLGLAWDPGLHGAEKTWFAVYEPWDERRVRALMGEFELATTRSGRKWRLFDATGVFEHWLAASEYREEYFNEPSYLEVQYQVFEEHLLELLRQECEATDAETLLAVSGIGSLFGFVGVSRLVGGLADSVRGRLCVFFPGSVEGSTYRLLNARSGWNYRAVAITASR